MSNIWWFGRRSFIPSLPQVSYSSDSLLWWWSKNYNEDIYISAIILDMDWVDAQVVSCKDVYFIGVIIVWMVVQNILYIVNRIIGFVLKIVLFVLIVQFVRNIHIMERERNIVIKDIIFKCTIERMRVCLKQMELIKV